MEEDVTYRKVDTVEYVSEGIKNGTLVPFVAEKFARIIAKPGVVGDEIVTWSVDSNGQPIIEKRDVIGLDEQTGNPGWVVTKTDENGNPIVDEHGHINQWIIQDSVFVRKYEVEGSTPFLYKPKGGPQTFVQFGENLIVQQWGSEMQVAAGGYINITNVDDMYAISSRDFEDTYRRVENNQKTV